MREYTQATATTREKEGPAGLEVVHPKAAGIDVGAGEMWVCVPGENEQERQREYGTDTVELEAIAA